MVQQADGVGIELLHVLAEGDAPGDRVATGRRARRCLPDDRNQPRIGDVGAVGPLAAGRRRVAVAGQVGHPVGRQRHAVVAGRRNPHAPLQAVPCLGERARRAVGDGHVGRREAGDRFAEREGRHEGAAVRGRYAVDRHRRPDRVHGEGGRRRAAFIAHRVVVAVVHPHPRLGRQRSHGIDRHRGVVLVDRPAERDRSTALVVLPEVDQPRERRFSERRADRVAEHRLGERQRQIPADVVDPPSLRYERHCRRGVRRPCKESPLLCQRAGSAGSLHPLGSPVHEPHRLHGTWRVCRAASTSSSKLG